MGRPRPIVTEGGRPSGAGRLTTADSPAQRPNSQENSHSLVGGVGGQLVVLGGMGSPLPLRAVALGRWGRQGHPFHYLDEQHRPGACLLRRTPSSLRQFTEHAASSGCRTWNDRPPASLIAIGWKGCVKPFGGAVLVLPWGSHRFGRRVGIGSSKPSRFASGWESQIDRCCGRHPDVAGVSL